MKQGYLRSIQVFGGLILALAFTAIGTAFWNMPTDSAGSLLPTLSEYSAIFLLGPGMFVAVMAGGVHDANFRLAQIANVVIYTGLGYVLFRFLEWRKGKRRPR
jgi:hypothetical protein